MLVEKKTNEQTNNFITFYVKSFIFNNNICYFSKTSYKKHSHTHLKKKSQKKLKLVEKNTKAIYSICYVVARKNIIRKVGNLFSKYQKHIYKIVISL